MIVAPCANHENVDFLCRACTEKMVTTGGGELGALETTILGALPTADSQSMISISWLCMEVANLEEEVAELKRLVPQED